MSALHMPYHDRHTQSFRFLLEFAFKLDDMILQAAKLMSVTLAEARSNILNVIRRVYNVEHR